jgi:hypothetical protein
MRELRGALEGTERSSGTGVSRLGVVASEGAVVDIMVAASCVVGAAGDVLAAVSEDVAARFGNSAGGG